jgi:hypothetical protein
MLNRSVKFLITKPFHPFSRRLRNHFYNRALIRLGLKKNETVDVYGLLKAMSLDSQWKTRLAGMKDKIYVCNIPHQFCGIGHLSSEWNAGFMLASRFDLHFVHAPLPEPWESFFGWGKDELSFDISREMKSEMLTCIPFLTGDFDCLEVVAYLISLHRVTDNKLFILGFNQSAYDQTASGALLREKYEKYSETKAVPSHKDEQAITVAVHIRKGDIIGSEKEMAVRYIDADWMARAVASLQQAIAKPFKVNVYSQGLSEEDKLQFDSFGKVTFYDNTDPCETFHNLMIADILVMSRSGFSYLAACMGQQVVVVPPGFWHHIPDDKRWIKMDLSAQLSEVNMRKLS